MKIAVVSDSHIGQRISAFPLDFIKRISNIDAIVHCGDYTSMDAVKILMEKADFFGVYGNMDDDDVRKALPEIKIFNVENFSIAITHGWGSPYSIDERVYAFIRENHPDKKFDLIFYGHSHIPSDTSIEGTRLLNPGALSGNIGEKFGSFGILSVDGDTIDWKIEKILPKNF